jgi:hypothetical protein
MKYTHGVRDKSNYLIGWFESEKEALGFINRYDPNGQKGYKIIKAN